MDMAVDEPWRQDLVLQGYDLASAAAFKAHDPALVYGNVRSANLARYEIGYGSPKEKKIHLDLTPGGSYQLLIFFHLAHDNQLQSVLFKYDI
jgi:hypothetical protein